MQSHAMNKVKTPLSAPVKKAIEAFEAYQRKHDDYGANDTEAGWVFHNVIRRAVKGDPFPARLNFELYSYSSEDYSGKDDDGVPYSVKRARSKQINEAMTTKARRVYDAIVNGPMANRDALRDYAWRVDID